jgi:hypothetical protein
MLSDVARRGVVGLFLCMYVSVGASVLSSFLGPSLLSSLAQFNIPFGVLIA